jgi:inosose dehydratase
MIPFNEITQYLIDTEYKGWIIMEDECDRAITDPDGVTISDGEYINSHIRPLL